MSVFGSRASGTYRKFSDVDLLIEVVPPFTADQVEKLAESLEESDIPLKFDLVTSESLKPEYATEVRAQKKSWLELR